MNRILIAVVAAAALAVSGTVLAGGDAAAGKAKAGSCGGCHGKNGEGNGPNPAIAGKSEADLLKALQDYKSGKRANAVMKSFAAQLGDQDMANVAAYYASLKK